MKIGVIGNGFVGKSTNVLKNENVSIYFYDINQSLCQPIGLTLNDMKQCDIIFISVPTPMNKDKSICKSSQKQEATDEYSSSMYGSLIKYADISVRVVDNKIKGKLNVYNNRLPFIFKNPDLVNILSKLAITPKPNSDVYMDGQLLISLGDSTKYSRVNIELNKTYNTITVTNSMKPGQYLITEDI